jgi:hypothetical protein
MSDYSFEALKGQVPVELLSTLRNEVDVTDVPFLEGSVTIYVDNRAGGLGSDSNDGLSPTTPVSTFKYAFENIKPKVADSHVVFRVWGEHELDSDLYFMLSSACGQGDNDNVSPANFVIRGEGLEVVDDNSGSNYAIDSVPSTNVLAVTGTPFVANAYRGMSIEWVTGTNAGLRTGILRNTTSQITHMLMSNVASTPGLASPQAGDTFRIVQPATVIKRATGPSFVGLQFQGGSGFQYLAIQNLILENIYLSFVQLDCALGGSEVIMTGTGAAVNIKECAGAWYTSEFGTDGIIDSSIDSNNLLGFAYLGSFASGMQVSGVSQFRLLGAVADELAIGNCSNYPGACLIEGCVDIDTLVLSNCAPVSADGGITHLIDDQTTYGPATQVNNGAILENCVGKINGIFNNSAGDALTLVGGKYFLDAGTGGTGTGGDGLVVHGGTLVDVGGLPTITGAVNEVSNDAAATSDWATIYTGTTPLTDGNGLSSIRNV